MDSRAFAFEIIIRHLSNKEFRISKEEIHKRHVLEHCPNLDYSPFEASFRYSTDFGFIEARRKNSNWHIKSVDEMCQRLRDLATHRDTRNDDQPLTVPLAFELIIHEFRDGTDSPRSTTEIENHIFNIRKNKKDDFEAGSVLCTLRFLNHFGFADKIGRSDYHIKSVDDMDKRLRDLAPNELPELFDVHEMLGHKTALDTELDHVVRDIEHIISHYNMPKKNVLSIISKKLS